MTQPDITVLNDLAQKLADVAAPVSMKYFKTGLSIDSKSDESPVTIADREAETAMRAVIEAAFPEHGIFGEEHGTVRAGAEYVWVLDPIDGTQAFVTGKPLFGTLIGLLHKGRPLLGVMDMPALKERWTGITGEKTIFNGAEVKVRPCPSLDRAWMYATSPQMFTETSFPHFEDLRKATRRTVYGAECYAYGLLAMGLVDVVCEDTLQPYDFAALVPIVTGAGGSITDWQGKELDLNSQGHVLASGDPALHKKAMQILAG